MAKFQAKTEVSGSVWQIVTKPGDKIAEGDPLIILESMKMEIPVLAEKSAVVAEILVAEGDVIGEGHVVAILEI
jgi:acetyl-CoA carboxylase biotin carboxyl carrier protein